MRHKLDSEILHAVGRCMDRTAALAGDEMRRGLHILASIIVTAPFLGAIGTTMAAFSSFKGCPCGEDTNWVGRTMV